jgi:hypothetical protein
MARPAAPDGSAMLFRLGGSIPSLGSYRPARTRHIADVHFVDVLTVDSGTFLEGGGPYPPLYLRPWLVVTPKLFSP